MRATMRRDLTAALKTRDRVTVDALRSALAAIENAEAPPADLSTGRSSDNEHVAGSVAGVGATEVARRELTEADQRAIVEAEVDERSIAAAQYEELGRTDLAERLHGEAAVLRRYLS